MSIKQVIVMRKDLKMRRGKEISQGSHASMMFLAKKIQHPYKNGNQQYAICNLSDVEREWLEGNFTKVCLQVNSEAELYEIAKKAKDAGIECNIVTDAGLTEFNGVPTVTCLALGPYYETQINDITGHLRLY